RVCRGTAVNGAGDEDESTLRPLGAEELDGVTLEYLRPGRAVERRGLRVCLRGAVAGLGLVREKGPRCVVITCAKCVEILLDEVDGGRDVGARRDRNRGFGAVRRHPVARGAGRRAS